MRKQAQRPPNYPLQPTAGGGRRVERQCALARRSLWGALGRYMEEPMRLHTALVPYLVAMPLLVFACWGFAIASEKYVIHDDVRIDDNRIPSPGKALIYFARTQNFGGAISVQLVADKKPLSWIRRKTFVVYECDPGKHEFASISEGGALLDADVLADRIYYVQLAIHMGFGRARSHFEVIRPGSEAFDEFKKAKDELRAITTTPEGLQWYEKNLKEIEDTIAGERKDGEEIETLRSSDGYEKPLVFKGK